MAQVISSSAAMRRAATEVQILTDDGHASRMTTLTGVCQVCLSLVALQSLPQVSVKLSRSSAI